MMIVENQVILVAEILAKGEESEAKTISIGRHAYYSMSYQNAVTIKEAATIHQAHGQEYYWSSESILT